MKIRILFCKKCGATNRGFENEACFMCGCRDMVEEYKNTIPGRKEYGANPQTS